MGKPIDAEPSVNMLETLGNLLFFGSAAAVSSKRVQFNDDIQVIVVDRWIAKMVIREEEINKIRRPNTRSMSKQAPTSRKVRSHRPRKTKVRPRPPRAHVWVKPSN